MASAEKGVQEHDQALSALAVGLEDWLAGRVTLANFKTILTQTRTKLSRQLALPKTTGDRVAKAETGLVAAVAAFAAEQAPDAEGQRSLFERLNTFTRDRSMALLEWRTSNNATLRKGVRKGSALARYLEWEAAWLPLWKSEIDLTFRLQKNALAKSESKGKASGLVREILAVQTRASALTPSKELTSLHEMAAQRLTLLARTAEQLERLGRGESRGALTRVRRLSKEQAELGRKLQEQRLALLTSLTQGP